MKKLKKHIIFFESLNLIQSFIIEKMPHHIIQIHGMQFSTFLLKKNIYY
jgi:hypothetical protein